MEKHEFIMNLARYDIQTGIAELFVRISMLIRDVLKENLWKKKAVAATKVKAKREH